MNVRAKKHGFVWMCALRTAHGLGQVTQRETPVTDFSPDMRTPHPNIGSLKWIVEMEMHAPYFTYSASFSFYLFTVVSYF